MKTITLADHLKVGIGGAVIMMIIGAFLLVGGMDYQDAVMEQQTYCDNVQAGYWPDYNGNAAEVCQ
jgi:hypothetical protein